MASLHVCDVEYSHISLIPPMAMFFSKKYRRDRKKMEKSYYSSLSKTELMESGNSIFLDTIISTNQCFSHRSTGETGKKEKGYFLPTSSSSSSSSRWINSIFLDARLPYTLPLLIHFSIFRGNVSSP